MTSDAMFALWYVSGHGSPWTPWVDPEKRAK